MSLAVCLNCGKIKHGALTQCECGIKPLTGIEHCLSITFTDKFPDISLEAMKELIEHTNFNRYWIPTYERLVTNGILEKYIKNPSYRRITQIGNSAKKRWFRDEIDMHSISPDGYEHSILVCGKDIDKKFCKVARQIGDNALYCLWTYESGKKEGSFLTMEKWFLAFDKFAIVDRKHSQVSHYLQSVNNWYDGLIDEYMTTGHISPQEFM